MQNIMVFRYVFIRKLNKIGTMNLFNGSTGLSKKDRKKSVI